MPDTTDRLRLPMIVPGQAQKEMTHNEALAALDIAVQTSVVGMGQAEPPATPAPGECWIVGTAPTGAWSEQPNAIAGWTGGGWRFVQPSEGFAVHSSQNGSRAVFAGGTWRTAEPVAAPAGGDVIDLQARTAIAGILAALGTHGLVPPGM